MILSVRRLFLLLVLVGTSGCVRSRHEPYASTHPLRVARNSETADRLWEAAVDTLRRHRFRLDRVDRGAGAISTMPVTSQHAFEFWRHDVDTRRDLWEATLNPMRRWVEVTLSDDGQGQWNAVNVIVHKQRFSSPDRQFNSSGAAYQFFGDALPSTTGQARLTDDDDVWLDQGRDAAMESYLLDRILARARLQSEDGGTDGELGPTP